jgi:hypothetical protein
MSDYRIIAAAVISLAATQAKADGLELIKGRVTHDNVGLTKIMLGLKNNTDRFIKMARVDCGFFENSELSSSGASFFFNVAPGETGYIDVREIRWQERGSEEKVTRVDCHISDIRVRD